MVEIRQKIIDYLKINPISSTRDVDLALGNDGFNNWAKTRAELDKLVEMGILERRINCGYIAVFLLK